MVSDLRQIASQVLRRDSVLRVALNSSPETASSAADAVADFVGTKVPAMSFHSEEANMEEASGVNDMKTQFELPFLVIETVSIICTCTYKSTRTSTRASTH